MRAVYFLADKATTSSGTGWSEVPMSVFVYMSLLYQDIVDLTDVQFCPVSNRDWECARDRSRECRERGRKWEHKREREREKDGRRN